MRPAIRIPVVLLAAAVLAFALYSGSFVAGGSDSSGYLSQARLWANGTPIVTEPLINQVSWSEAGWTFAPLGYKPGVKAGTIVPVYSAGYPMLMGAIQRIFGPDAHLTVVPLSAAGLIVCTSILGGWAGGAHIAMLSSLLLATSPPFVYQSLQPMSDIPVTFWWTLSAVLAFSRSRVANAAAAASVAAAILTRPNLVPLAVPMAVIASLMHRQHDGTPRWLAATAVAIGAAVAIAITAVLNTTFYGGPMVSGYGAPGDLYALQNGAVNLPKYLRWLIETETLLVALSLAGIIALAVSGTFQRWLALHTIATICLVLGSYVFYIPFDIWNYVRFLLPMYPFLFIAILSVTAARPFHNRPRARKLTLAAIVIFVLVNHARFIRQAEVLDTKALERRYAVVALYVRTTLPSNAVFLTMQHSGSIRYNADRRILRYDLLPPQSLDRALADLTSLGYQPYFLLDNAEEPAFQARFAAHSGLAKLDWQPIFDFRRDGTRIYDPAERRTKD